MPEMTCFACEREPTQQCSRCGRPYCDEHGEELCDACMEPSSGVPSVSLYRGSMLALLIGTAIAIYLLVKPGGSESAGAVRPIVLTPTVQSSGRSITIPPAGSTVAPGSQTTPGAVTTPGTPRPAGTVPAAATPAAATTPPAGAGEYTVASGDTLSAICEKVKPATMTVPDCVERIVALNNLRSPNDISIGDRLRVPR